jgi:hypothetical protein
MDVTRGTIQYRYLSYLSTFTPLALLPTMKSPIWSRQRYLASVVLLFALISHGLSSVRAQRFMRQGFSGQEDFGSEMKLEDSEGAVDMTREMFLMQDLQWYLQPLDDYSHIQDRALRRHIMHHLQNKPVALKLLKKRGKLGLRAVGRTESGRKLRAFWRPAPEPPRGSINFLEATYDEACRARLFTVEFEVQLPALKRSKAISNGGGDPALSLPSLVYQLSVEPGSVNVKALVPRSSARVLVYPSGRKGSSPGAGRMPSIPVGTAHVTVAPIKSGLIDTSWAKGRPIFRKGRNSGLM